MLTATTTLAAAKLPSRGQSRHSGVLIRMVDQQLIQAACTALKARSSGKIGAVTHWRVLACAIFLSSIVLSAIAAVYRIEVLQRKPLVGGESFGEVGAYTATSSCSPLGRSIEASFEGAFIHGPGSGKGYF